MGRVGHPQGASTRTGHMKTAIDITQFPLVPCDEAELTDVRSAAYALYRGDKLVYIGQTGQLPSRLRIHRRKGATHCRIVPGDKFERLCAEAALLKLLKPSLNGRGGSTAETLQGHVRYILILRDRTLAAQTQDA